MPNYLINGSTQDLPTLLSNINVNTGGFFIIGILFMFWLITFSIARQNSVTEKAFTVASFSTSIIAFFFGSAGLIEPIITGGFITATIVGLFLTRGVDL